MREVVRILSGELDNISSSALFLSTKGANFRDSLVYVYTQVCMCVYKQVAHMPMSSSLKFQLLTCWKNWVHKLFLPPGTLTQMASTHSVAHHRSPCPCSITGVIIVNMVEQLLKISPMYST